MLAVSVLKATHLVTVCMHRVLGCERCLIADFLHNYMDDVTLPIM